MAAEPQAPVLVVGAGPTGLACALELARLGVAARIVEKATGRSPLSRAIAINPRTLELLAPTGATARLRQESRALGGLVVHPPGGDPVELSFAEAFGRPVEMRALPQTDTERVLEEALGAAGIEVERGREFVSLDRQDGGVLARFAGGEPARARLLVGADGAHSVVRRALGVAFDGWTDPAEWSLADFRGVWPYATDRAHLFLRPDSTLFAIEVSRGVIRLVSPRRLALDLLPAGAEAGDVIWRSQFHVAYRVAASFRAGPVFLAGDAAHVESPAGARGMNLGIEDGVLLARRIAEGRLDGWTAERRPVARRVVRASARLARAATLSGPLAGLLRRWIAPRLLRTPVVQRRLAGFVLGAD